MRGRSLKACLSQEEQMKKKKIIGIVLMVIFTAAAIVSGVMFARQYSDAKASVDTFDDLAGLVVDKIGRASGRERV